MIRKYQEADFDIVTQFWFEAMETAMPGLAQRLGHTLEDAREFFKNVVAVENDLWVYVTDGKPVGFLGMQGSFIDRLYVDPAHHRQESDRRFSITQKRFRQNIFGCIPTLQTKWRARFTKKMILSPKNSGSARLLNRNRMWNIIGGASDTIAPMRPTYLEVNLNQLKQNLENIRAHVAPAKVLVVLKANAYGHGVDGVAPFIAQFADYIGVAIPEEGINIRRMGITTPILVMGGTLPEQIPDFLEYDLTLAASSLPLLESAEQAASAARKRLKAHLKIDTGMERIGVREYEAQALIKKSLKCKNIEVEGIFTHFANSEEMLLRGVRETYPMISPLIQLERFEEALFVYETLSEPHPQIRHTANSGATLLYPQSYYDMVRPGVLFYGVYPGRDIERNIKVNPALTWKSKVIFSKITEADRGVSYGSLWHSETETRILTIPCGYADGYFRRMTNQPKVVINGKQYQQVGRICMDQFMVNAGADEIQVGTEVSLLGNGISPEDLADWAGTNEYEVMTNISARVPRVFV